MRSSFETTALRFTLVIGFVLGVVSAGGALAQDVTLSFDGSAAPGEIFIRDGGDAPTFVEGRQGQAISFGERAVVALPFDADPRRHPQLSVSLWLKIDDDATGTPWIFRTDGRNLPAMRLENRYLTVGIRAADGTGNLKAPVQLPIDEWVHVVKVWDYDADARSVHLHVGGEEFAFNDLQMDVAGGDVVQQLPVSAPGAPATAEKQRYVFIGANNFKTYNNAARGISIDDVRIFTHALSTNEVVALGSSALLPDAELVVPRTDIQDRPNTNVGFLGRTDDDPVSRELPAGAGSTSEEPVLTAPSDLPGQALTEELAEYREGVSERPLPACRSEGSTDMLATSFGALPAGFVAAVNSARECRNPITAIALTASGQWVVATDQQTRHSLNLPAEMAEAIQRFEDMGRSLDAVAIAPNGQWVVVAGNQFEQRNLPANAVSELTAIGGSGARAVSFAIDPDRTGRWVMVRDDGLVRLGDPPPGLLAVLADLQNTQRKPHLVAFAPDDGWLMLTSDHWYATSGIEPSVVRDLRAQRLSNHRIDHVVFYRDQGARVRISNGLEPARSDSIWQVENSVSMTAPAPSPTAPLDFGDINIWRSMQDHGITGLSIAIVRNNQIAWARGYGLRDAQDLESVVHTDTVFDGASVSKAIAAFGILQLFEQEMLEIDEDGVLEDLRVLFQRRRDRRAFDEDVRPEASNLIQILQHCAGILYRHGDSGAGEYPVDAQLPLLSDLILGTGNALPAQKVLRSYNSGVRHDYSGANYVLTQALIEVLAGSFTGHMRRLLDDLDMVNSTYETPAPARNTRRFARGHDAGVITPIYAYPEMAPASLTTTAIDLSRFIIAINQGGRSLLSSDMVRRFIGRTNDAVDHCISPGSMALGINRSTALTANGQWNKERFWHNGDHNGYHAKMVGFPSEATGIVAIMTATTTDAEDFWQELAWSISRAYGLCPGC